LYIHAGCPESGRLSTLHSYDVQSSEWARCADAPDPGRGGTAIAAVKFPSSSSGQEVIIRFGGMPPSVFDMRSTYDIRDRRFLTITSRVLYFPFHTSQCSHTLDFYYLRQVKFFTPLRKTV
jgi:hypothetical protein